MSRTFSCLKARAAMGVMFLVMAGGLVCWTATPASAEIRHSTSDDMFYNYYVPPAGPNSVGAQLYVCPRPAPPLVGHTYITYPPLMPHEMLYQHHRVYWTQHQDAPPTRTSVHWGHGPFWWW